MQEERQNQGLHPAAQRLQARFGCLLAGFQICWAIWCILIVVLSLVGLMFLATEENQVDWLIALAGSVLLLPAGWFFIGFVRKRLDVLSKKNEP